jgi:translation initiation factor 1
MTNSNSHPFAALSSEGLPPGPETPQRQKQAGRVVLRRETAHRGGKTVIVVDQLPTHLPVARIEELARQLRKACGCGGTVKGRTIEIQGNQPARIRSVLESEGFEVAGVK